MGAGSSAVAGPVSSLDVPLPPLLSQGRGLGSAPPALALVNHSRGPSVPQQPLPQTNIFYLEGHRRQMSLLFPSTDSREAEGATWGRGCSARQRGLPPSHSERPPGILDPGAAHLCVCLCVCVCVCVCTGALPILAEWGQRGEGPEKREVKVHSEEEGGGDKRELNSAGAQR